MKSLVTLTLTWLMLTAWVSAQPTFSASSDISKSQTGKVTPQLREPEKLKPFAPQGSGVVYEISEKGLVIISPVAPKEYGVGEKFLTSNPFPAALAQDQANERRFGFGGIKVIGFDF